MAKASEDETYPADPVENLRPGPMMNATEVIERRNDYNKPYDKTNDYERRQDVYAEVAKDLEQPHAPRRLLGQLTSEQRKQYPMATGLLDYFPDALALVAHISWKGNEKHNPGQDLHWAREKSMDHPDCIMRHLVERYELDDAQAEHSASLVWRALADLQQFLEIKYDLDPPRAARDPSPRPFAKP